MSKLALMVVMFLAVNLFSSLPTIPQTQVNSFTPNNLVVVRVGSGTSNLDNSATAVFLDEYTTNGTLVQSVALPTNAIGNNRIFTLTGTGVSEGAIGLSADGKYLTLGGYDAAVGIGGVAGLSATIYNRVVARVASNGTIDTSSAFNDVASGDSVRSAITDNGANLWVTGGASGIRYAAFGNTGSSTQLNNIATNNRVLKIFANQLYYSTGALSPARGIHQIGTGLPSSPGQSTSLLATPAGTNPSPYDFSLLDLDEEVAGLDTLYFADDRPVPGNGGIHKWSFNGTNWTQATIFNNGLTTGVRGLTVQRTGNTVTLYATTTDSKLVRLIDDGTANPGFSLLISAPANTAFRGIAFTPLSATNIECTNPFIITSPTDDGTGTVCGTLSYALAQSVNSFPPPTITFALSADRTINFSGTLSATVQTGVVIDGGICANPLTLKGASLELGLQGNNYLRNLRIESTTKVRLISLGKSNKIDCVAILKN